MRDFGENVGMAFQIRDDLFDYTSRKNIIGKPVGGDMKEKKITLPLIRSFQQAPKKESRRILKMIRNGAKSKDVEYVIAFAHQYGGIDYAVSKAEYYSERARECLQPLPDSPAKEALMMFVDFVMERTK
jgi:octaprenyl-diphosphate synthase